MDRKSFRVIIAGGGTGGHLYPGIAVAEELKRRIADVEIYFIGTDRGIEAKVLPKENYFVKLLNTEGFVRVSLKNKIRAFFKLIYSFFDALFFIISVKPDVVIGTGGYASIPAVSAAAMMFIPTMILEQNSIPGLSNRMLSKIVRRICVTYESSLEYFPKAKSFITGNPIRRNIVLGKKENALETFSLEDDKFTLFIFGGSAGAENINKTVVDALQFLVDIKEDIQILHQTGDNDYEFVRSAYLHYGFKGMVTQYIFQMAEAYSAADVVLSRAGATTLAEITASGLPSILIPYPYAAVSHQEVNASKLSDNGAALMIKESELSGRVLAERIRDIYLNTELREKLAREALSLGKPRAAEKVVSIAVSVSGVDLTSESSVGNSNLQLTIDD